MRTLALMAFFALQLSVFTCGFDIHVHAMDADMGHVAGHLHDEDSNHDEGSHDHGCHVHASKNLSFLIEHPPKIYRG
jgi:hypothetical protein